VSGNPHTIVENGTRWNGSLPGWGWSRWRA
jgi:hypothetical protein